MKKLTAFLTLVLISTSAFAREKIQTTYLSKEAIQTSRFSTTIFNKYYHEVLAHRALERVKATLRGYLPAGNEGRAEQIKNLQLKELQLIGVGSYVRSAMTGESLDNLKSDSLVFELYFEVPAGHGLETSYVGVGFESQAFELVDSHIVADGELVYQKLYKVPELNNGDPLKDAIHVPDWKDGSAVINYTLDRKEIRRILRQR